LAKKLRRNGQGFRWFRQTGRSGRDQIIGTGSDGLGSGWGRHSFERLVNNGDLAMRGPVMETSETMLDQMMNVHLNDVYFLTQNLLPMLADGGRIVHTLPGHSAYAMMKGGVGVLTRSLATEHQPRGITANTCGFPQTNGSRFRLPARGA
jgi:NAD(P)-dependent dehydrogenase (short-subunit alcohol dehydrogenase family)